MLIRREHLEGIVRGDVTLAFRRWKRPTVKAGGTLNTALGQLAIEAVDEVTERAIRETDAKRAGFASRAALLASLRGGRGGSDRALYRVRLSFGGADPRVALRANTTLTADDLAGLRARLERYDAASQHGPWTVAALRAIETRPATLSTHLAETLGFERFWFKTNVRKLKALGLTESLDIGYRLSPRGRAFLKRAGLGAGAPATRRKKA